MSETVQYLREYLKSDPTHQAVEAGELVRRILIDAITADASDIHIEPWESSLCVRIRCNGVLQELVHLPLEFMDKIFGVFKVKAQLVTYQNDLPQEGHVPGEADLGGVEQRVSIFPTARGGKIVVRLFDPSNRSFDLNTLGFDDETLLATKKLLTKPSGLLLLTGPTGSGKTTAMYSALCYIYGKHGSTISMASVEDPVEFNLQMIAQAQVNNVKGFTYPVALRSLMRQDPQVIMIGEIRDAETAQIAVQAGLTGHLVISTIHSGSTAGVFARMINMNIEPFLLASSIIGVLGTRLVRRNCPDCRVEYSPDDAFLRMLPREDLTNATFMMGGGCGNCFSTGFSGRTAVTEMLVADQVFRDAVMQKMSTRNLQQVAVNQGMRTLWDNGVRRAMTGESPLEEILRVISFDDM